MLFPNFPNCNLIVMNFDRTSAKNQSLQSSCSDTETVLLFEFPWYRPGRDVVQNVLLFILYDNNSRQICYRKVSHDAHEFEITFFPHLSRPGELQILKVVVDVYFPIAVLIQNYNNLYSCAGEHVTINTLFIVTIISTYHVISHSIVYLIFAGNEHGRLFN